MAETLIFSTGSDVISGSLISTASISQLNLDSVSGSFTGTFIGDGSGITGLVSASHAAQADNAKTSDLSATASYVAGANVDGTVESASLAALATNATSASFASTASFLLGSVESASDVAYDDVRDKPTLISSSAQFDSADNFTMGTLDVTQLANFELSASVTGGLGVSGSVRIDPGNNPEAFTLIGSGSTTVFRLGNTEFNGRPEIRLSALGAGQFDDGFLLISHRPDQSAIIQTFGGSVGSLFIGANGAFAMEISRSTVTALDILRVNKIDAANSLRVQATQGQHAAYMSFQNLQSGNPFNIGIDNFSGSLTGISRARFIAMSDITNPMVFIVSGIQIRITTSSVNITNDLIVSGNFDVLGDSSLAQTSVEGATGSFTGSFIGEFTGSIGDLAHVGPNLGFYTTTPIVQQTGVAVTDVAIHAALVALGLFTA